DTRRYRRPAVPLLWDVEREAAPRLALVVGVEHAHAQVVAAQRPFAQPRHQLVVVAPLRLEKPPAHRLEGGGQRIERLLYAGEAPERPIEIDRVVRRLRGGDEGRDQLHGLSRQLSRPTAAHT